MGEVNERRELGGRERGVETVALEEGLVRRSKAVLKEEMSAKDVENLQRNEHPPIYTYFLVALHSS